MWLVADGTIAVLGTGTMGTPIARHLLEAGFGVRVWNRTRAKAEPLAEAGATVCDTPVAAVEGAEVVLTVLSDGDAVEETMSEDGALAAMGERSIWIQVSTVGIEFADRFAGLAQEAGVGYVDAPVLGTKEPAERGQLVVLASGLEELHERCKGVFDAYSKETIWVGDTPGLATRLKLVVNLWLLSVTEAAAEAIALAQALGIDPRLFLSTMEGSQIDTPYLHVKGEKILGGELSASFRLELACKDANLVVQAAEGAGVDLPLPKVARERFARAVDLGHGDEDMAATYFASAPVKRRREP
jgi:3-hydroxyisobutyrate dehydrogenase